MKTFDTGPFFWGVVRAAQAGSVGLLFISVVMAAGGHWAMQLVGAKLNQWQTLVAGFMAVFGAMKTVQVVRDQIAQSGAASREQIEQSERVAQSELEQAERHNDDSRQRALRAARAELPPALSQLTKYVKACLWYIRCVPRNRNDRVLADPNIALPALYPVPEEALVVIRRCIEHCDEQQYDALATLLEKTQIQYSRLLEISENIMSPTGHLVLPSNIAGAAVDAIEVHARIDAVWPFARRQSQTIASRLSGQNLQSIAFFNQLHEEDFPGLDDALSSLAEAS